MIPKSSDYLFDFDEILEIGENLSRNGKKLYSLGNYF